MCVKLTAAGVVSCRGRVGQQLWICLCMPAPRGSHQHSCINSHGDLLLRRIPGDLLSSRSSMGGREAGRCLGCCSSCSGDSSLGFLCRAALGSSTLVGWGSPLVEEESDVSHAGLSHVQGQEGVHLWRHVRKPGVRVALGGARVVVGMGWWWLGLRSQCRCFCC